MWLKGETICWAKKKKKGYVNSSIAKLKKTNKMQNEIRGIKKAHSLPDEHQVLTQWKHNLR